MQRVQCNSLAELIERFNNDKLLTASSNPMTLSTNEEVFWCNDAFVDLVKYSKDEVLKRNFKDITFEKDYSKQEPFNLVNGKPVGNIDGLIIEKEILTSEGDTIYVSLLPTPLYDQNNNIVAYWVVFRDITENKKIQEDLFLFRQQYTKLLESLNMVALRLDPEGTIIDINSSGAKLFGWSKDQLIGKNWFDTCIPLELRANLKENYLLVSDNIERPHEDYLGQVLCSNGKVMSVLWKGIILRDESGKATGSISVGEDYTEKAKIDSEKEKLVQNIVNISRFESVAQLVGGVAHEFNNVLSIILGFNKLALKSVNSEDEMKTTSYLIEVDKAGKRAAKLIEQLQAYSKKNNSTLNSTNLEKEVQELASLAKSILPTTINLQVNISTKLQNILTDATLLHQSLMNLLLNAQEAMKSNGKIEVNVSTLKNCHEVCTSCHHNFEGDFSVISIRNTGQPIPEGVIPKIFDPFFSTKGVGQGTGMGLSVVHGFIHGSKGHVTVTNTDEGVEFNLYFPTQSKIITEDQSSPLLKTDHGKILVVDDEESLLFLYKRILKNIGFEADCFADPLKALEQYKNKSEDYSLIITDQTMPGMLGLDLIETIKGINPNIHSMLISGYTDVVDQTNQENVDDYFIKPVDVSVLTGRIKEIFSK